MRARSLARLALVVGAAFIGFADHAVAQQQTVETRGTSTKMKIQEVVYGHLQELNGKFKFRVVELTFEPDGFLGGHHHMGPGIRYVAAGQLVFTQAGKSTTYKTGDYFFESGNVVHTAHNRTKSPTKVILFEIVPAEYGGPSVIPPKP